MKLFSSLSRNKKKNSSIDFKDIARKDEELKKSRVSQEEPEFNPKQNPKIHIEKKEINLDSKEDRVAFIRENCEQILESQKQAEETKVEYQLVTSYLSDMQKIDLIPLEDKSEINDSARKIVTLTREREKYQSSNVRISSRQFKYIERYEDDIPTEIKKMKENEDYQIIIKNDMRHLEGEKGVLKYQKKEIIEKQKYLKGLSIIVSILGIVLFLLFIAINYVFNANMLIPFLLTIIMMAVAASYIFYEARKNRYDMKLLGLKQNKAIYLLNRVKIKYVNNTSVLDYSYSKHMVSNYHEFRYLWEQYLRAKDEAKSYKQNSDLLSFYNELLVKELTKYRISDPEVWIYQAVAIIDPKEMVEVRHRLNVRRQKLRERIDYNNNLKESGISEIQRMVNSKNSFRDEIVNILSEYQINI